MADLYNLTNGTLIGNDITNLFVYANQVTGNWFVPFMIIAFFILVLVSSLMMQLRMTGRLRPETSFVAASFASLGFVVILTQKNGLISNPWYVIFTLALSIIGVIWLALSSE